MHRDYAFLYDILNSAKTAVNYLENVNIEDFYNNIMLQDSVIRRIEIIGEASSKVSIESQKKHPHLPWREMKKMRNILIHEYDDVNLDIVWNTVKKELPSLIKGIEKILN